MAALAPLLPLLALALVPACGGSGRPQPPAPAAQPTVVFLSDFGTNDDAVAICKGVMLELAPGLRIVDVTHDVPPFSIRDGARLLAGPPPYFPAGTVFLAVVDPGVGGARRAVVARSRRGHFFVVPDNGLLTVVADRDGIEEAREITDPAWMRPGPRSATFHGRDVFAPVAARLARGDDWRSVGPVVTDLVRLDLPGVVRTAEGLAGEAVALDGRFGNVLTNVAPADLAALGWRFGDRVRLRLAGRRLTLPFVRTFADVPEGAPLVYVDSRERVGLAVNRGSFAEAFAVRPPAAIVFHPKDPPGGER